MVDEKTRKKLLSILNCALSESEDTHLCKDPIQLTCSHYICKVCLPNGDHKSIRCNICQDVNQRDLNQPMSSKMFHMVLDMHVNDVFAILFESFSNKLEYFKNVVSNSEEILDLKLDFVKDQIQLRIESLKIALDKLNESLIEEIENIKNEWISKTQNESSTPSDIERFNKELDQLKVYLDEANKQNLTENNLYHFQNKIKELNAAIKEYEASLPDVSFETSSFQIQPKNVGDIVLGSKDSEYINAQIIKRLKENKWENLILEKNERPDDLCVLSNGKLLSTDYKNAKMYIHGSDHKVIRTIESINGRKYNVISIDTNKLDAIFFSTFDQNMILKTDFEFNQLASFGGSPELGPNSVHGPCGICFSDGDLYVCDYYNKRVQKLNANLALLASYPLSYSPWYIKIIKNIALIRRNSDVSIHFHDANTFIEIRKYEGHSGVIGSTDLHFYEYDHRNKTLYYYNSKGVLVEDIETEFRGQGATSNGSIYIINSHLIINSRNFDIIKV